ncbi:MAG: hypothetical protein JW941_03550 [Candidatus Coatesbacteria bacterium]|nr:hypothetical protein [Candidatus Coatesbacteria bacterium]
MKTPRDAIRLVNSVALRYSEVEGEVKCPDYVAINALNVFCPLAYDVVVNNKDKFTFLGEDVIEPGARMDELKGFHGTWFTEIPKRDRSRVRALISVMFPALAGIMEALDNESA